MINEKNKILTVSWLSGLLSAEIFISTPDLWKQPFSAVRASGGYPGNAGLAGFFHLVEKTGLNPGLNRPEEIGFFHLKWKKPEKTGKKVEIYG